MTIEEFIKQSKAYVDENVDAALEYARNNPHKLMNTEDHAVLLLLTNIVMGVTGMSPDEMEKKLLEKLSAA